MTSLITFIKTTPAELAPSPPIKPLNETLEILSNVNEFYNTAWSNLLWLIGGTFAILAIGIPILIQYLQKITIKASEKELENTINLRIEEAKKEIENEMNSKLEIKMTEHEKATNIITSGLNGQILHLQANSLRASNDLKGAFKDYCLAISYYALASDIPNIIITVDCINICLESLTKEDIFEVKNVDNVDIAEILNDLVEEQGYTVASIVREVRAKLVEVGNRAKKTENPV